MENEIKMFVDLAKEFDGFKDKVMEELGKLDGRSYNCVFTKKGNLNYIDTKGLNLIIDTKKNARKFNYIDRKSEGKYSLSENRILFENYRIAIIPDEKLGNIKGIELNCNRKEISYKDCGNNIKIDIEKGEATGAQGKVLDENAVRTIAGALRYEYVNFQSDMKAVFGDILRKNALLKMMKTLFPKSQIENMENWKKKLSF